MDIFGSILEFIQSPFTIISVVFWIIAFTLYLILGRKKKFVTFLFPFVALFRWKVFNKFFARVARRHKKLWKIWWNIGIVVSFVFMLLALYFFISNLLQLIIDPKPENAIMPLIPGVTISLPMFSQFLLPILITVTIHEFSHAIAAETDGVNVKSSGIMGGGLFFILGFGAFVEVDDFQLYSSKFKTGTRLRVYAAGVWSNIILAGVLFLIINFYPAISSIAYTGQSDRITSVLSQDSGGFNENNIEIGDIIYQINGTIADSNKRKGLSNVLANETALSIKPGDTLNLTCWDAKNNSYYERNIVLGFRSFAGIAIQKVSNSEFNVTTVYPALNGGNNENNIPVGTIIKSFNSTLVDYANHQTFEKFLSTHEPNYTVNLTAVNGTSYEIQVNYFPKAPGAYIFKDIFLGLNYQQLSVNSVKITNVFKNNTEYGINEKHIEENTVITAVNGIHLDLSNQTFAEFIETEINPQSGDV
ncbi:MAG: site-2 protease family protein, partial [Promethearchaeota archaeon]